MKLDALEPRLLLAADLAITESPAAPTTAVPGQLIDYSFTITNVGAAAATGATFTDTLPSNVTVISTSASSGAPASSSGSVSDNLGTLAAGASETVVVRVTPNVGTTGTLTNTATVSSADDTSTGNNTVNATTVVAPATSPADLALTGSATTGGPATSPFATNVDANNSTTNPSGNTATAGQDVTFNFTVTNNSTTATASNVQITDMVPAGSLFLMANSGQGTVTESNGLVTANVGTLAPGASATITVDLAPTSPVGGGANNTLADTAFATTDSGDSNLADNSVTDTAGVSAAGSAATLGITKTDSVGSSGTAIPGQDVTYTITVTNNASQTNPFGAASNVNLFDTLPGNVNFISATAGASSLGSTGTVTVNNGTVTDSLGDLQPGESTTLTIVVSPKSAGTINNQAVVTSDSGFTNATGQTTTVTSQTANDSFTVGAAPSTAANLSVTKTDSLGATGTVAPGQALTYTITVTNNDATNSASNVVLTDSLPSGLTYVTSASTSSTTGGGGPAGTVSTVNPNNNNSNVTVTDNIGTLAPGQSVTMTLMATPNMSGTISNTANATASSGISSAGTPSATDTITAGATPATAADLSLTKTDSGVGKTTQTGQQVTYTINVTNNSMTNTASNVVITDNLPAGLTYDSSGSTITTPASGSTAASTSPGGTTNNSSGTVTDTISSLAPGQTANFTIVVTPTNSGNFVNTAIATTNSGEVTPRSAVSSDSSLNVTQAPPQTANLAISKIATPTPATTGQNLTYTITVDNTGGGGADNVVVTDALPSGETFVSDNASAGTANQTNGTVTANFGTIAAGATDTLTIVVKPTQTGNITNTASLTTSSPNAATSTTASTTTPVSAPVNVSVTGTADVSGTAVGSSNPALTGQDVAFTFTVTNNDTTNAASNVVFTDTLPSGATFLSAMSDQGTVSQSGGTVTANLGTLAPGASTTVTIDLSPNTTGTLTDTGSITTSPADTSSSASATVSAPVNAASATSPGPDGTNAANLTITKTDSVKGTSGTGTATPGQLVTYTITVTNNAAPNNSDGTANLAGTASNVTLYDALPSGVTFVSATAAPNSFGGVGNVTVDSNSSGGTGGTGTSGGGSSDTVVDHLGDVLPGQSETLTIVVSPNASGMVTNNVTATSDSGFANATSQTASDTFTAIAAPTTAANLKVTKTDSLGTSTPVPGQAVTYTITVTNNDAINSASNVVLTDSLPGGLTYVSSSSAAGSASGSPTGTTSQTNGAITDNIGTLAPGQSTTMTLVAMPMQSGAISNTAVATTSSGISSLGTPSATDTITVGATPSNAADLSLSKLDSGIGKSISQGQQVTYTIVVSNNSTTNTANNVVITDSLPAGLTYNSNSSTITTPASGSTSSGGPTSMSTAAGGTTNNANGTETDTLTSLAPGQFATFTIVTTATQTGPITNTAVATTSSGTVTPRMAQDSDTVTIAPTPPQTANLAISKIVSAPATVGQNLTYTITVDNTGGAAADNVVVTDMLPAGETFVSDSASAGTANQSNGMVTANFGTIAAGATDTLTIVVTPTQTGNITNTASLTTTSPNAATSSTASNTTTVTSPVNVSVTGAANVSGTAVGTSNPALVGQDVSFTFTVTNNDTANAASNVVFTDTLPTGATFLTASSDQGSASQSGGTVTANLGTLAPGASTTVTIELSPNTTGTLSDTGSITTSPADSSANTSATVSVPVSAASAASPGPDGTNAANLTITKTDSVTSGSGGATSTATPGQLVTYTITVTNNASPNNSDGTANLAGTASNVSLYDTLPSGVTFVSATAAPNSFGATGTVTVNSNSSSAGGSSSGGANANTIVDALGDILPGQSDTLTIVVSPNTSGTVTNTVLATSDSGFANATSQTASDTFATIAAPTTAANLKVTKTDSIGASGTVVPGQAVTYTITVTNNDTTNSASNVVLTDSLPSGLTYVSSSSTAGAASGSPAGMMSQSGGTVTDTVGTLAPGQSTTMTLVAVPDSSGMFSNTAVATTSSGISGAGAPSATDTITVGATPSTAAEVSVSKVDSGVGKATLVGQQVIYTVFVNNLSTTNTANNVVVTDNLPAGLTYSSSSSTITTPASGSTASSTTAGGTIANTNGTLTDTIASLAPGQYATFQIVVTPTQAGMITNSVAATSSSGLVKPTEAQDSDTLTVLPTPPQTANLAISKIVTGPATVGQNLTYVITVDNTGAAGADNVVVTDALPAGETFVSDSASAGTASQTGGTVTATFGTIAAGTSDTLTIVVTPTQTGDITNTASLTTTSPNAGTITTASNTTTVGAVSANQASLSISKLATPNPDAVGQGLTYTITVINSGAAGASNVVVTDPLPAGVTFVSDSASVGTVSQSNGTVTATLGALASGATATVTIVVTPTAAGTLSNTATVSTTSPNANPNTSATITTTISNGTTPPPGGQVCYLAGQPGDSTDATFIRNLYRELLGREPDAQGQAAFFSFLGDSSGTGASTADRRNGAVTIFLHSTEYRQHLVNCIYENFLGRAVDPDGLQYWTTLLADHQDEKLVIAGIVGSDEYYVRNGNTSQGFVTALYRDILGRAPDPAGNAYWVGRVDSSGDSANARGQITAEFLSTPEAEHKLLDGNFEMIGAPTPQASPGAPANGAYALANLTGNGWDNLYFEGRLNSQAADSFFSELQSGGRFDSVMEQMLDSSEYFTG